MEQLAEFLRIALLIWLGAVSVVVFSRLLRGDIATTGLLCSFGSDETDPERVSLFTLTLAIAFYYVVQTMQIPVSDLEIVNGIPVMPDLPTEALYIFGGGQGAYLSGKVYRLKEEIFRHGR